MDLWKREKSWTKFLAELFVPSSSNFRQKRRNSTQRVRTRKKVSTIKKFPEYHETVTKPQSGSCVKYFNCPRNQPLIICFTYEGSDGELLDHFCLIGDGVDAAVEEHEKDEWGRGEAKDDERKHEQRAKTHGSRLRPLLIGQLHDVLLSDWSPTMSRWKIKVTFLGFRHHCTNHAQNFVN